MDTDDLTALRLLAKEAGIRSWHVKGADTLQKELDALTGGAEPAPEEAEPEVASEKLVVLAKSEDGGITWETNTVSDDVAKIILDQSESEAPEQPTTHEIPEPQPRANVRMQHPRTGEVLMVWDKDVAHYRDKGWNIA